MSRARGGIRWIVAAVVACLLAVGGGLPALADDAPPSTLTITTNPTSIAAIDLTKPHAVGVTVSCPTVIGTLTVTLHWPDGSSSPLQPGVPVGTTSKFFDFSISPARAGTYTLSATSTGCGPAPDATLAVTGPDIVTNISTSPTQLSGAAFAATGVTFTGSGFHPDVQLAVTSNVPGFVATSIHADDFGDFAFTQSGPASTPDGYYSTTFSGDQDGDAPGTFLIGAAPPTTSNPVLSLSTHQLTLSQYMTTGVTAIATGYVQGDLVLAYDDAPSGSTYLLKNGLPDSTGQFATTLTGAQDAVADRLGVHTVRFTSFLGPDVTDTFTVVPNPVVTLTAAPDPVEQGAAIEFSATNMTPDATVILLPDLALAEGGAIFGASDGAGAVTVDATIPADYPVGQHSATLLTLGTGSGAAPTVQFTVIAPVPVVSASPALVQQGDSVTVAGEKLAPSTQYRLIFDTAVGATDPTVATDADGAFSAAIPLPVDYPAGSHGVTVTAAASGAPADGDPSATFAVAAPTLAASPSALLRGDTLTVAGSRLARDTQYRLVFDIPVGASDPTVTTDADGAFSAAIPLPADYPAGDHDVAITAALAGDPAAGAPSAAFAVLAPSLAASPSTVVQGDTLTVSGSRLARDTQYRLVFDIPVGASDPTVTTDSDGDLSTSVPVPVDYPTGSHSVTATAAAEGTEGGDPSAGFGVAAPAIPPSVSVDPGTVLRGDSVTVSGSHLSPSAQYRLVFDAAVSATDPTVTTDADGSFSAAVPLPVDYPAGDHQVVVTAAPSGPPADDDPSAGFDVATPMINADPATLAQGDALTVSGSQLARNTQYRLVFDTAVGAIDPAVTTDADGGFSIDVPLPADYPTGGHTVVATTSADGTEPGDPSAPFSVLALPAPPMVTVDPTTVHQGDTIAVAGTGLSASSDYRLVFDAPVGASDPTVTTDADGSFSATVTIPADYAIGEHSVTVTAVLPPAGLIAALDADAGRDPSASFAVVAAETTAPPTTEPPTTEPPTTEPPTTEPPTTEPPTTEPSTTEPSATAPASASSATSLPLSSGTLSATPLAQTGFGAAPWTVLAFGLALVGAALAILSRARIRTGRPRRH